MERHRRDHEMRRSREAYMRRKAVELHSLSRNPSQIKSQHQKEMEQGALKSKELLRRMERQRDALRMSQQLALAAERRTVYSLASPSQRSSSAGRSSSGSSGGLAICDHCGMREGMPPCPHVIKAQAGAQR